MRVQGKVEGVLRIGDEVWLSGFGTMSIYCPRITLSILFFFENFKFSVCVKYLFLGPFYLSSPTELGPGATNTKLPETAAFHN